MGVGGAETARGIAFQHAQAVAGCVDALESADVEFVRVEGVEDIIDFELCAVSGQRLRVCQAKTRKEPYVWAPGDIVTTIKRWQDLSDASDPQFEFLTDGSAGPELTEKLQPALRRARTGGLTDADRSYLASKGLDATEPLLARVAVESRQPDADVLLDRVAFRIMRLLEIGLGDSSTSRAEALVNELFRLVSVRAGKTDPDERVITRVELSSLVGVGLDVIDSTRDWDNAVERAYVNQLRKEPPHPWLILLKAESISVRPRALALVLRAQAEKTDDPVVGPATEVLSPSGGAVLSGPPGAGKSTTVELLVTEALDRGLCPVLVSVEGYEAGGLRRLIRDALERRLGYQLAPVAVEAYLSGAGATLFIDGAGELVDELRESLVLEVQQLRRNRPLLRTIVTSRDPARLNALGLPTFLLQGLTYELRRRIADELLHGEAETKVRGVEEHLGDVVNNPLLFVMALSLADAGVHPTTRAELFERFLEGLSSRPGGAAASDIVLALLREVCFELRCQDAYASDRWTWRRLLRDGLARLAEQRLFPEDAMSANEAFERAQTAGLLRVLPSSGMLALTHDLFCDFFAAEAVRLRQRALPEIVGEALEELVVFLAERGALRPAEAAAVSTNPVAAARAAAAEPLGLRLDDDDAAVLLSKLCQHLGRVAAEHEKGVCIRTWVSGDDVYAFALPADAYPPGSDLDPDSAADAAIRVVTIRPGASSLGAAVAVFLAELRAAIATVPEGTLVPIPVERSELPAVLEAAFVARTRELRTVCDQLGPTLADRIIRVLGQRGFHALVFPVRTSTLPVQGGIEVREHPVVFSFNAPDISARLADSVDRHFVEEPSTQTICEGWLRDSPAQAALKDLKTTLSGLLPGLLP